MKLPVWHNCVSWTPQEPSPDFRNKKSNNALLTITSLLISKPFVSIFFWVLFQMMNETIKKKCQRICISSSSFVLPSVPYPIWTRRSSSNYFSRFGRGDYTEACAVSSKGAKTDKMADYRGGKATRVFTSAEMITFLSRCGSTCILTNCNMVFMDCLMRMQDTARHWPRHCARVDTENEAEDHFRGT